MTNNKAPMKKHAFLLHCYTTRDTNEDRSDTTQLLYKAATLNGFTDTHYLPYQLGDYRTFREIIRLFREQLIKPNVITNNYRFASYSTSDANLRLSRLIKEQIIEIYQMDKEIKLRKIEVDHE